MYLRAIKYILKISNSKSSTNKLKYQIKSLISDIYLLQRLTNEKQIHNPNAQEEGKTFLEITEGNDYLSLPSLTSYPDLNSIILVHEPHEEFSKTKEEIEQLISSYPEMLDRFIGINSKSISYLARE